jgi:hypothetical protein
MSDFERILGIYSGQIEALKITEQDLHEAFSLYLRALPKDISQTKLSEVCNRKAKLNKIKALKTSQSAISAYQKGKKKYPAYKIPLIYGVAEELLIAHNSAFKSTSELSEKKSKSGKKNNKS